MARGSPLPIALRGTGHLFKRGMIMEEFEVNGQAESVVDAETAGAEFDRWASAMKLNLKRKGIDENERRDIESDRLMIIDCIIGGIVTIGDDGLLTYAPEDGRPFTFHRPRGADLVVMDKKKKHAEMGKVFTSLASITRTSEVTFSKMYHSDLEKCLAIWSLFLV